MKGKVALGILIVIIIISSIFVSVSSVEVNKAVSVNENVIVSNEEVRETSNSVVEHAQKATSDEYITEDDLIYSNKYLVKENNIYRIDPKTSIEEFRKNIEIAEGKEIKIYKGKREVTEGYVGTGMIVKEAEGKVEQEYILSVIGDMNGDGIANQIELTMIIRHIVGLEEWQLEGLNGESADITGDGKLNLVDVSKLINYIVYGKWEYEIVKTPEAPGIRVISEKIGNTEYYLEKAEIEIETNPKVENGRTTYKIAGDKVQEEREIKKGEIITLEGEGNYIVTAYTYGQEGNRSRGTNRVIRIKGKYTVIYSPGEEGLFSEQKTEGVKYGEATPKFEGEIKGTLGYMFMGWEPKLEETVTKNVQYVAKWEKVKYVINFSPNGGNYTMPSEGQAKISTKVTETDTEQAEKSTVEYVWSKNGEDEPQEGWTEFINGSEIEKTDIAEPGIWYLWVKVKDKYGNVAEVVKSQPFIVKPKEDVANKIIITPNTTTWTNQDVTLKVEFGENLTQNQTITCTGIDGKDYIINGTEEIIVKTNGKEVTVTAEDIAGNKVVVTLIVNNIDKELPMVSLSPNGGEKYTMPSEGNGKLSTTLTAEDKAETEESGCSGLNVLQYAWSQSKTEEPTNWANFTNGSKVEKSDIIEPGTWYLWTKVIDNAGNRAEEIKVSNAFTINSNTDEGNKIILTQDKTEWTNGNVTVTAVYGKNLIQNRILTCMGTEGTDFDLIETTKIVVKTNHKTVTAVAEDIAGNRIVSTLTIENIDKIWPTVQLVPDMGIYTMPTVGNAKINARIIAEDLGGSTLDILKYAWTTSNTTIPMTGWTDFTNGSKVEKADITEPGIWYLWVIVTDKAGNRAATIKSNAYQVTSNTEKENQITLIPDKTEWTNQDVIVTAKYGENLTQNRTLTYTGTAGTDFVVNSEERIAVKTNNGTVTCTAQDKAGNLITRTLQITNIDKVSPTTNSLTASPTNWTNRNVILTGKGIDRQSGIVAYQFSQTNNLTATSGGWTNIANTKAEITQTKEVSTNGIWYFYMKDAVGNVSKRAIEVKIDKEAPTVEVAPNGGTKYTMPTTGNAKISTTITATDPEATQTSGKSGLNILQYAWSQSNTVAPTSWINFTNGSKVEKADVTRAGTWYLWTKVVDHAENTNIKVSNAFTITANTEGPNQITLTANPVETKWTNQNVIVTVAYGANLTENRKLKSTGTAGTDYKINGTASVEIKTNGKRVTAEATDIAGNKIVKTLDITKLDKEAPEVTNELKTTGKTTSSIDLNIGVTDNISGISKIEWYYKISNSSTYTKLTDTYALMNGSNAGTAAMTGTKSITRLSTGTYNIYAIVYDVAGNSTRSPETGTVDVATREVPTAVGNVTFAYNPSDWTNGNVSVTMTKAVEVNSYTLQYSLDNNTWVNYSSAVQKSENGRIYARLVDSAGNVGGVATGNVTNIDKTAPTIISELKEGVVTSYVSGDVAVNIKVEDGQSGLKKVEIKYKKSTENTYKTVILGEYDGTNESKYISGILNLQPETTYNMYAVIYDVATNTQESNTITVTTDPAIWRNETTKKLYPNIAAAFVRAESGDTLTLLRSYTDNTLANLYNNVTVNLNSYTLTKVEGEIVLGYGATLNLNSNGTIRADDINLIRVTSGGTLNISRGIFSSNKNVIYNIGGSVNISGGTFREEGNGYATVYNRQEGILNITDGNFSSTSTVVRNSSNGEATISGGTFSGDGNVVNNSNGEVNISGGTFRGEGNGYPTIYNQNEGILNIREGNFSSTASSIVYNHKGETNIYNGTFTTTGGNIIFNEEGANLTISGGEFASNINEPSGTIQNAGTLNITGGTIRNNYSGTVTLAIYKGDVNISGGSLMSNSVNVIRVYYYWDRENTIPVSSKYTDTRFNLNITGTSTELISTGGPTVTIDSGKNGTVTIGTYGSTNNRYPYISNDINNQSSDVTVRIYSGNLKN